MAHLIETMRLYIRAPNEEDLLFFQRWLSDPELAKFVGGVRAPERILQTFEHIQKNWREWGFGTGMLVCKAENCVIGSCGINRLEVDGRIEYDLGYLIIKEYWNNGFATEAAKAVLDYAVKKFGIDRVTAWPSQNNLPSVKIAESLGFKFEKTISKSHAGTTLNDMRLYVWHAPTKNW